MEDRKKDKELVEKSNLSTNVEPFVPRNFTKTVDVITYDPPPYYPAPPPVYSPHYCSDPSYGGAGGYPSPYYSPPPAALYPAAAAIYPSPDGFAAGYYEPPSPHFNRHNNKNKSHASSLPEDERRDLKDRKQSAPREFGGRGKFDGARRSGVGRRGEAQRSFRRPKLNSLEDFPSLPNSGSAPLPQLTTSLTYSSKVKEEATAMVPAAHKPSSLCPNNTPLKELNANKVKKKDLQNMYAAASPPSNNELLHPKHREKPHHHPPPRPKNTWERDSRIFFKENRETHDKNIYRDDLPDDKTNCKAFHTNLDHSHKFCQKTERLKNEANSINTRQQRSSISLKYKNNLDNKLLLSNSNELRPAREIPSQGLGAAQGAWQSPPPSGNLSFINTKLTKKPFKNQANLKNFINSPKKCFKETFKNSLEPDDHVLEKLNIRPPSGGDQQDTEEYPDLWKSVSIKVPRQKPSLATNANNVTYEVKEEPSEDHAGRTTTPGPSQKVKECPRNPSAQGPLQAKEASLVVSPEKPKDGKNRNPLELDFTNLLKMVPKANQKKKREPRVLAKKQSIIIRPANLLDSSAPLTKKGKEREFPRPKKPSHIKKIIILEKEEKKKQREQILKSEGEARAEENSPPPQEECQPEDSNQEALPDDPDYSGDTVPSDQATNQPGSEDLSQPDELTQPEEDFPQSESNIPDPTDQRVEEDSNSSAPSEDPTDQPSAQPEVTRTLTRQEVARVIIHTRKFREYCTHLPSAELDATVQCLLTLLLRFQDRAFQKDPVKAKTKRRLVFGLREITKHLKLHKLKAIVFATDIEKIDSQGGLTESLTLIQELAARQNIRCVYSLRRLTLGRACLKKVSISCIGIFNFEGADKQFWHMVRLSEELTQAYDAVMSRVADQLPEEALTQLWGLDPISPQFHRCLTHLRRRLLPSDQVSLFLKF